MLPLTEKNGEVIKEQEHGKVVMYSQGQEKCNLRYSDTDFYRCGIV